FGSEPKAIINSPDIRVEVDASGIAEIFALGPARTPGHGIYKHLHELRPGEYAEFDRSGLRVSTYWQLASRLHEDDESTTIDKVSTLLQTVTESQLVSD